MHEYWLQKYIKEYHREFGFAELYGPFTVGADFRGVYDQRAVKVEAEWGYSDYVTHGHGLEFADILVVATLEAVPEHLAPRLPSVIINLNREHVEEWAHPRIILKEQEDYSSYAWRRFSMNLLYLYDCYRKQNGGGSDFAGSQLLAGVDRSQNLPGFQFSPGGKQEGYDGLPEDKACWDHWLDTAHAVADHFRLKPALLRPTWIDRVAIYASHTGRVTEYELRRFKDVASFIDELIGPQGNHD